MDAQTLAKAMGNTLPLARYMQLVGPFNAAMLQAGITNVNRAAMWCAQLGEESHGLAWPTELASGAEYNGMKNLGNTHLGDGVRYKGRSYIQVTGRYNYTQLSKWAFRQGIVNSPTFFVDHPEQLATDRFVLLGPVWYWTVAHPDLNELSDRRDFLAVTKVINGGKRGLPERWLRYQYCLTLGAELLPTTNANNNEELSMADIEMINDKLSLILDQLAGPARQPNGYPAYTGWPQLGGKTVVDALADVRNRVLN